MALTLIESAKLHRMNGNHVEANIVEMFAMSNRLMQILPFKTINGSAYKYNQEGELPGVAFRGVNGSFDESTGVINPQVEPLHISGGDLDVDVFIVKTEGEEARSIHENMKIKAVANDFQRVTFKGDSSTNPKEPDGLQRRLTGDQVISNKRANSPAGGEVLSLAKLDDAINAVYNPTHIFVNKKMHSRLSQAARNTSVGGNIQWAPNEFGKQVMMYGDLPIIPLEDASGRDLVLPFTETSSDGASTDCTSIYVVSVGEEGFTAIQNSDMEVRDLGEIDSKPVYRTRVEWYISICLKHGRCAARLMDIIDGAVVA